MYTEYKKDAIKHIAMIKKRVKKNYKIIKGYFNNFRKNVLKKENQKKYITLATLIVIFSVLIINLFISFGYYHNEESLLLLKGVVGNIYLNEYDYTLLVYLEEIDSKGNGNGRYYLTDSIPAFGYNYSGYKCENGSSLIYDEESMATSVSIDQKELCSVYFDIIDGMDLTVKIMLEDEVGTDNYAFHEEIPPFGYRYSHYECANNGILQYDSTLHKVTLSSSTAEHCSIYFKKESADIIVNLFVESEAQSGVYNKASTIPPNVKYTLNDTTSSCKNTEEERIDASMSYVEGYINIGVSEMSTCNIYLDRINE